MSLFSTTIIEAHYNAAFEYDMTSWDLTVDMAGRMGQTIDSFLPLPKRDRRRVVLLDEALVLDWIIRLEELDFARLEAVEREWNAAGWMDDCSTYELACHFSTAQKAVTLRSLDWLLMRQQPDMVAFRAIWDAIHDQAPFPTTRRPWSAAGRQAPHERREPL